MYIYGTSSQNMIELIVKLEEQIHPDWSVKKPFVY